MVSKPEESVISHVAVDLNATETTSNSVTASSFVATMGNSPSSDHANRPLPLPFNPLPPSNPPSLSNPPPPPNTLSKNAPFLMTANRLPSPSPSPSPSSSSPCPPASSPSPPSPSAVHHVLFRLGLLNEFLAFLAARTLVAATGTIRAFFATFPFFNTVFFTAIFRARLTAAFAGAIILTAFHVVDITFVVLLLGCFLFFDPSFSFLLPALHSLLFLLGLPLCSSSSSSSSSSPTASQGPLPMPPGATGPLPSLSGDLDVGSYKELATRMHSATANGLVFLYDSPLTGCFSPGSDSNSDSNSDSGSTASSLSPSPSPTSSPSSPFSTPTPPPLPPSCLASDKADDSNLRIHPLNPSNDGWPPYVISFRGCLFLGNGLPHAVEQFSGFGSTFDECEFWDCSIADLHFDSGSKSDMHRCVFAKQGLKRQEGWDVQVDTPRYSVYSTTLLKYNVMGGGKIRIHSCDVDHPMAAEAGAGIVRTPEEVTVRITGTSPDFRHVVQPRVY
mmetsp:Transcript_3726/g.6473  ORF Transcript_3726/g.6473 Transcript_3726/m.6473 type:complete len:503 (-) Transcript_3726:390-1898(-)